MHKILKSSRIILCCALITLLLSCSELTYDPSCRGDVPYSPSTEFRKPFKYQECFGKCYTEEDLSKTISLPKLFEIALANNPATKASWYAARAAAYGYHASRSAYYPAITYQGDFLQQRANGTVNVQNINSGTGATGTTSVTSATSTSARTTDVLFNQVTASYLFLDFGGRQAEVNYAYNVMLAADWEHDFAMQQVILSVLNAYTGYLGNKALVAASLQNLNDAKVSLDAAIKMRNAGLATLTDILSAQSAVEQMQYNLEQAKGAEKISLANLLIALGLPPTSCLQVEDLPEKLPVIEISGDVCSLIEKAKTSRPDIAASIAAVKEQQDQLVISYSAGMPTLTLNASKTKLNFIYPNNPSTYNNTFSVDWNVPLFAGFYYVNQQKQIKAQIKEALANLDVLMSQVETAIVTEYYTFKTAEAAIPLSESVLEYSLRAYRGELSQYKVGTASILDLLTSLTNLSNARAQQAASRTQWADSLANLAFAVGVLGDTREEWRKSPPERLIRIPYQDDKKKDEE